MVSNGASQKRMRSEYCIKVRHSCNTTDGGPRVKSAASSSSGRGCQLDSRLHPKVVIIIITSIQKISLLPQHENQGCVGYAVQPWRRLPVPTLPSWKDALHGATVPRDAPSICQGWAGHCKFGYLENWRASYVNICQMWNNGTLHPIKGMFVDDSVCPVVPAGSTWARNPVPRIHTDNIGMAFVGGCWGQNGPPGEVAWMMTFQNCNECVLLQVCRQAGAPWCPDKEDCSNFPTPCPHIDRGW